MNLQNDRALFIMHNKYSVATFITYLNVTCKVSWIQHAKYVSLDYIFFVTIKVCSHKLYTVVKYCYFDYFPKQLKKLE